MSFKLTVLGCSSATPTLSRHSSAQVLKVHERLFLIDCGEGAQIQMRKFGIKFQRIDHIFISHLHGDHFLGLMGLLLTLHLLGRKNEIHLYANPDLEKIIDLQLEVSNTNFNFPLIFHALDSNITETIFEDENIIIKTIPLDHRIPTSGFIFTEKPRPQKIRKEIISKYDIPFEEITKIKMGADFSDKTGKLFKNSELTFDNPPTVSYAYCSDTGYTESYLHLIKNCNLLYNEATFMHNLVKNARDKYHCTSVDAANIALKAGAKQLLLGHYSARYDDLQPLLKEAKQIFENTLLA
ncbi:MAG: ribonuclease Z, partial [Bacteroidetes bacterium]|nr:ribonuclease Z [Bacteroidota bacterium]